MRALPVNASLGLDGHGKALSFFLLTLKVEIDEELLLAPRRADQVSEGRIASGE
jgi:hypothetical protein